MRAYRGHSLKTNDDKLGELYKKCDAVEREIEEREEEVLIAEGCYGCGGEVGTGSMRLAVTLIGPCSEGQMHQSFIICHDCSDKIWSILHLKTVGDFEKAKGE